MTTVQIKPTSNRLTTELKSLFVASAIVAFSASADELSVAVPKSAQSDEEITEEITEEFTDKDAIKNRRSGGRVIEYGGEVETNSGVVPATVRADPTKSKVEAPSKPNKRNINQGNSVKLITGGDPSDGNAKSGHLPVLD